ncbi:ORF34 [Ranid herpesvirus 2]|uniref:ORF34 n=1 Tax=Ranid herpesvirus 2 TaxID=389214 RepID=Q14W72_9VIRU|nr:ORF34 [Ranid herpesvirus 2]ABG25644.1 ORF34 [Ranid herpesvirus 2]
MLIGGLLCCLLTAACGATYLTVSEVEWPAGLGYTSTVYVNKTLVMTYHTKKIHKEVDEGMDSFCCETEAGPLMKSLHDLTTTMYRTYLWSTPLAPNYQKLDLLAECKVMEDGSVSVVMDTAFYDDTNALHTNADRSMKLLQVCEFWAEAAKRLDLPYRYAKPALSMKMEEQDSYNVFTCTAVGTYPAYGEILFTQNDRRYTPFFTSLSLNHTTGTYTRVSKTYMRKHAVDVLECDFASDYNTVRTILRHCTHTHHEIEYINETPSRDAEKNSTALLYAAALTFLMLLASVVVYYRSRIDRLSRNIAEKKDI